MVIHRRMKRYPTLDGDRVLEVGVHLKLSERLSEMLGEAPQVIGPIEVAVWTEQNHFRATLSPSNALRVGEELIALAEDLIERTGADLEKEN